MNSRIYDIEFLTPCFCAGADQTRAELRPPSIRGQLRWWFRCLGGTPAEERAIFGGVHGQQATASTLAVRVLRQPQGGQKDWRDKIPQQGNAPRVYLLGFFCGRTGRLKPKRALPDSDTALPPGSTATIEVVFKRPPSELLDQTLRVFFSIGALGFRATRAAGAFASKQHKLTAQSWAALADELRAAGFQVALFDGVYGNDWVRLLDDAEELLKNKLRGRQGLNIGAGRNGSQPNVLGSARPRQASVLHLRPVRIDDQLRLALIEAPHQRILGQRAQQAHGNRGPVLTLARERGIIAP